MDEVSTSTLNTLMGTQLSLGTIVYGLVGMVATWYGIKAVKGTAKFAFNQAKNIGIGMVGVSALAMVGLAGTGYSFGELKTRDSNPSVVTPQKQFIEDGVVNLKNVTAKVDSEGGLYPSTLSEEELVVWKTLSNDQKSLIWSNKKAEAIQQPTVIEASYEAPVSDPFEVNEDVAGLDAPQVPLRQTWSILFTSIGMTIISILAYNRKTKRDDKANPYNV